MPRKGIICGMCGGEFFERSFPIHQKACAAKQQHIRLTCQHCQQEVPKLQLEQHLVTCSKAPKARPASGGSPSSSGPLSSLFDSSGRLQCTICYRWFAADRVAKHQSICASIFHKKRQVFDSFKQRKFDPLIHRAAPTTTSSGGSISRVAAARSYYSSAPALNSKAAYQAAKRDNAIIRGEGQLRVPGVRGVEGVKRSVTAAAKQPPKVASHRNSKTTKSSVANSMTTRSARSSLGREMTLRPLSPGQHATAGGGLGPAQRGQSTGASHPGKVAQPPSPSACSTSATTGGGGRASAYSRGLSPSSMGKASPGSLSQNRGIRGSSQMDTHHMEQSSRLQRGRGPSEQFGAGGGLSTSNVCSPDNPFAYPHYPS
ncbi:uncharacterized protein LOC113147213 [Cyclospora cayetanensis]|uniref:Uncharacterized protein LOC113147213 n=1 Tax=Cyclospora cayetanensis TaxID=88456 RepID=A0A6P6RZ45_9EIME|nr:uncharacterized protein LOC113147213 [Cyclospora cayetanensis]